MLMPLYIPLAILVVLFLYFAFIMWRYSATTFRDFVPRYREELFAAKDDPEKITEVVDKLLNDIGGYMTSMNNTNRARYRIAAIGMLAAALAVLSALALLL